MATLNDAPMDDAVPAKAINPDDYDDLVQTPHTDAFAFSETEQFALQLYDQLRELELEKSLLEAHQRDMSDVSALSDDILQEHLIAAEREAMEAKARFEIRNRISCNVLISDPVLKAVHGSQHHTIEKRLLPLISENDALSMVHGLLTTKLTNTQRALGTAERGNVATNKENRTQSSNLLKLAGEVKTQSTQDIGNPLLREQVEIAQKTVKEARKRKAIIKGILSAMIVGSGINWAADEELRELVMDDEEAG